MKKETPSPVPLERAHSPKAKDKETNSPFSSQLSAGFLKALLAKVRLPQTLDKVFLDPTGGGDQSRDHLVFGEVADDFSEAGGDQVGGVAEEDSRSVLRGKVWVVRFWVRIWVDWVFYFLVFDGDWIRSPCSL